jgi:hypothetical protein
MEYNHYHSRKHIPAAEDTGRTADILQQLVLRSSRRHVREHCCQHNMDEPDGLVSRLLFFCLYQLDPSVISELANGVLSRLEWNPALDSDCSGLYVDWWVCIGVQPQSVTASFEYITSAPAVVVPTKTGDYTPTTFPAVDSSFTASPTQAGLATNCQAFYQAQSVSAFALSLSFLAPTAKICK